MSVVHFRCRLKDTMGFFKVVLFVLPALASGLWLSPRPSLKTSPKSHPLQQAAAASLLAIATLCSGSPSLLAQETTGAGFEDFAKQGGVMEARPSCFMNECGAPSRDCFTNPSCLKGVTCLGRCRGEQACATQCFARFGSEKLNRWLSCTLEEKGCVTTGVDMDTTAFYASAPTRLETFDPTFMEGGPWWKVVGYSPKYDCFACQKSSFRKETDEGLILSDVDFRVEKILASSPETQQPKSYWQNSLVETLKNDRGPQGKATFTVDGKMYGLSFREQWYVLASGEKEASIPPYVFVAYKGDTQQGPYDGAFVFTKDKNAWQDSKVLRDTVGAVAEKNGIDPTKFCNIDNACPSANVETAGASATEQTREKLTWSDVFELTEWFRPGTLAKVEAFDPSKMT